MKKYHFRDPKTGYVATFEGNDRPMDSDVRTFFSKLGDNANSYASIEDALTGKQWKKGHKFDKKLLVIGFGTVSKCSMPLLFDQISFDMKKVTFLDAKDKSNDPELLVWLDKGATFEQINVVKENYIDVCEKYCEKDGMIIDLAYQIQTEDILDWCYTNDVFFINTSVEEWIDIEELMDDPPKDRTLYYRQYQVMEKVKGWRPHSRTCVVDHGANPGLISHFVKKGLVDLANKHIADNEVEDSLKQKLQSALDNKEWNKLPYLMDVKTIHCSERDTQISNNPKRPGEFVGTWSIEGLVEEGRCPAEIGWGSHEKIMPEGAQEFTYGNKNQIHLSQMGINTYVRSIVPTEDGKDFYLIKGMTIRHGESFGISDYMTIWGDKGELVYRPTCHYAYFPCDFTVASLYENAGDDYTHEFKQRIMMDDEIVAGSDILGALICGHRYKTWWCGSLLSIDEARKLCPGNNATSLQVAASLVSACKWMITNPNEGYNLPCCLPWEQIMENAEPYLGTIVSQEYDWTPLDHQEIDYPSRLPELDRKDPWQFTNFLVRE